MAGISGSICGIPFSASRVVKFKHLDKSIAHIGPDFGDDTDKWSRGAMADSGVIIYCSPLDGNRGILKIDTNTDNVTELDRHLLTSCALAVDGCIYLCLLMLFAS